SSLSLISDALHMFSDIAGFAISLIAIFITKKQATKRHTYGFHRAEVVGAIFSISLIWAVTAFLVKEAIERVSSPEKVDGLTMLIVASCGLVVNIIMLFILNHQKALPTTVEIDLEDTKSPTLNNNLDTKRPNRNQSSTQPKNLNIRSAIMHVIGD